MSNIFAKWWFVGDDDGILKREKCLLHCMLGCCTTCVFLGNPHISYVWKPAEGIPLKLNYQLPLVGQLFCAQFLDCDEEIHNNSHPSWPYVQMWRTRQTSETVMIWSHVWLPFPLAWFLGLLWSVAGFCWNSGQRMNVRPSVCRCPFSILAGRKRKPFVEDIRRRADTATTHQNNSMGVSYYMHWIWAC